MRPVDDAAVEKFLTDLLTTSHVPYPEQLKFAVRGHVQDLLKARKGVSRRIAALSCLLCHSVTFFLPG